MLVYLAISFINYHKFCMIVMKYSIYHCGKLLQLVADFQLSFMSISVAFNWLLTRCFRVRLVDVALLDGLLFCFIMVVRKLTQFVFISFHHHGI